ncbi:acetylxylan esterase 2 [Fusarium heterosporum]|uniref:Acetylxylan esterase 2 n=1 Tax=Fusarium heterosporum TaxID=42747 RepID=A0A8H5U4I1_FUSHE|nr:acetylxylan esterase 2 [Fusarium heterosporum]
MISFMLLLSFFVALVVALPASALNTTTCAKGAHIIVARGSLEAQGPGAMGALAEEIIKLIPGSDMEALVYPALYDEYLQSQPEGVRVMTSVGAHVIADTMCGASSTGFPGTLPQPAYVTDHVASIILMGDPSLTEGQTFLVGSSKGNGMFPRNLPEGCEGIASKTVSVCDAGDPFCEAGGKDLSVHLSYIKVWGEYAVSYAVKAYTAINKSRD